MTELPEEYRGLHRFRFGDSRRICDLLTPLAISGQKRGTCWAYRDAGITEPVLEVGDRAIYTDWDGNPVLVVEFTKIEIHRFEDVPDEFALSEGEGTVAEWRRHHIDWFEREGGWSPDMEVVCENFRVVEVFDRPVEADQP